VDACERACVRVSVCSSACVIVRESVRVAGVKKVKRQTKWGREEGVEAVEKGNKKLPKAEKKGLFD